MESSALGIFEVRFHSVNKERHKSDELLVQFSALSLFYKEASKVTANTVPASYWYKIAGDLNRVYEVEEYMGDRFMVGLARLHSQHKQITDLGLRFN